MKIKTILIVSLLALSQLLNAANVRSVSNLKISAVYAGGSFLMVSLSKSKEDSFDNTKLNCVHKNMFALDINNPNYNVMSNIIMNAFRDQSSVFFYLTDSPCSGQSNKYPSITAVFANFF